MHMHIEFVKCRLWGFIVWGFNEVLEVLIVKFWLFYLVLSSGSEGQW